MFGLGTKEIIIIALVLILFFGATRIPVFAKSIAEAIKSLKGMFKDDTSEKK
jgi:TatA/E family protein of Tat protein translocase